MSVRPVVTVEDVEAAAARLRPVLHQTPVVTSASVDRACDAQVLLKCENLQRTGAFKLRGAFNALASMTAEERARGVFAFSSGNHAQAVALAARLHGVPAAILMPQDAPAEKLAATRDLGAEVVLYDRYTQERGELAREHAAKRNMTLLPPYDHPAIMAGAGTVALELLDQAPDLDLLVVPLGGGGLLAGCSTVFRSRSPDTRIVGVEPRAGDDWRRSFAAGERVAIDVPRTIADGLQVATPGELTWPVVHANVDEVVVVDDDAIVAAMQLLLERTKLLVEPSGAVGVAALLAGELRAAGSRVGVVLSGGNIGAERLGTLIGPARPGR